MSVKEKIQTKMTTKNTNKSLPFVSYLKKENNDTITEENDAFIKACLKRVFIIINLI